MVLRCGHERSLEIVLAYVEAAQRARATGSHEDSDAVGAYLAPEVEFRLASPWTDKQCRTAHTGADALVDRPRSAANAGTQLTTETVNAVAAGDDVLIEQVSTLHTSDRDKVSCVAHLFTVVDNQIAGIRTYRNDAGSSQYLSVRVGFGSCVIPRIGTGPGVSPACGSWGSAAGDNLNAVGERELGVSAADVPDVVLEVVQQVDEGAPHGQLERPSVHACVPLGIRQIVDQLGGSGGCIGQRRQT